VGKENNFPTSEIMDWRVKAPQQREKQITGETEIQKDGWMLKMFCCKSVCARVSKIHTWLAGEALNMLSGLKIAKLTTISSTDCW
jgi:hypothetical protein